MEKLEDHREHEDSDDDVSWVQAEEQILNDESSKMSETSSVVCDKETKTEEVMEPSEQSQPESADEQNGQEQEVDHEELGAEIPNVPDNFGEEVGPESSNLERDGDDLSTYDAAGMEVARIKEALRMMENEKTKFCTWKISPANLKPKGVQENEGEQETGEFEVIETGNVESFLNSLLCLDPNIYEEMQMETTFLGIHPVDIRNVIFESIDPDLRTFMSERLHQNRLAIPLLLTDPSTNKSTLYLRNLTNIHYINDDKRFVYHCDERLPIFGFARVGETRRLSKSIILNKILAIQERNVFFNREMTCWSVEKLTHNGTIDFFWLYEDKLNRPKCLLLNLHGDCQQCPRSLKLLAEMCNETFIFADDIAQTKQFSEARFTFLIDARIDNQERRVLNCAQLNNTQLGIRIKERIYEAIDSKIDNSKLMNLGQLQQFCQPNSDVLVTRIKNPFMKERDNVAYLESIVHEKILAALWVEWSRIERSKNRYRPKENEMMSFQQAIDQLICQQKKVMKRIKRRTEYLKIQKWLQFITETLMLPSQMGFVEKISCFDRIGLNFSLSNLVTQIARCVEVNEDDDQLLEFGAQLLLNGLPVELMNGEATVIYTKWIEKLFKRMDNKSPKNKVIIISTIGLESSGKSTLLNAMFGFKFRTSPGKCTSGAHMQLLEMDERIQNELGYTHLLVVDVEGLYSNTNQSSDYNPSRDNELATLLIGLSDLCLINVMGENLKNLENFLNISILALLRMKKTHLSCDIVFVHQNVADPQAITGNLEARALLQKELENAFEIARKEEDVQFTSFDEFFNFSYEKDVFYFPHFVIGTKPKAFPNDEYVKSVSQLKNYMLRKVAQRKKGLSFPDLALKLNDVWQSVLSEDFVFSFRNTLELNVYGEIEKCFGVYVMELTQVIKGLEKQGHLRISNGDFDAIPTIEALKVRVDEELAKARQSMVEFLSQDPHKEIKLSYSTKTLDRMNDYERLYFQELMHKLRNYKESCMKRSELEENISYYDKQFLGISETEAKNCWKYKLNAEQMNDLFKKIWEIFMSEHLPQNETPTGPTIREQMENKLMGFFKDVKGNQAFFKKLVQKSKDYFHSWTVKPNQKAVYAEALKERLTIAINEKLSSQEVSMCGISVRTMDEIISICYGIGNNCIHLKELTKNDVRDITVTAIMDSCETIESIHSEYLKKNDIHAIFASKESHYKEIFDQFCQGLERCKIIVTQMRPVLTETIENAVVSLVKDKLEALLVNLPEFHGKNKKQLICGMLKYFASEFDEKKTYELVMDFIYNAENSLSIYIRDHLQNIYAAQKNTLWSDMKALVQKEMESILINLAVGEKEVNFSYWLDLFQNKLREKYVFPKKDLSFFNDTVLTDVRRFNESISHLVAEIFNKLKFEASAKFNEEKTKLVKEILNHKIGCCEQCPFCGAICERTIANHDQDHSTFLHFSNCLKGFHTTGTTTFFHGFCPENLKTTRKFKLGDGDEENNRDYVPYHDYRKWGPPLDKWDIQPGVIERSFWMWFIVKYQKKLEAKYGLTFSGSGKIPQFWNELDKTQALQLLDKFDD